jgi:hypothetical protein
MSKFRSSYAYCILIRRHIHTYYLTINARLFSVGIGGNLIGSFLQNAPQFASSALGLLFGRRPNSQNSGSSSSGGGGGNAGSRPSVSNGASTLPGTGSFPILSPGGGSGARPSNNIPSAQSTISSSNCKCIPLNSCFLPSRPNVSLPR